MNLKSALLYFVPIALAWNPSFANEKTYGLGTTFGGGLTMYFPVMTGEVMIEPTYSIYSREGETVDSTTTSNSSYQTKAQRIGVGVFKLSKPTSSSMIYFGARVALSREKDSSTSVDSGNASVKNGFILAPTIGVEYFLINEFSIGLDASFNYSQKKEKVDSRSVASVSTGDTKTTEYFSQAQAIIRYRF